MESISPIRCFFPNVLSWRVPKKLCKRFWAGKESPSGNIRENVALLVHPPSSHHPCPPPSFAHPLSHIITVMGWDGSPMRRERKEGVVGEKMEMEGWMKKKVEKIIRKLDETYWTLLKGRASYGIKNRKYCIGQEFWVLFNKEAVSSSWNVLWWLEKPVFNVAKVALWLWTLGLHFHFWSICWYFLDSLINNFVSKMSEKCPFKLLSAWGDVFKLLVLSNHQISFICHNSYNCN